MRQMVFNPRRFGQPSTACARLPLPAVCVAVLSVPCARAHLDASCHFGSRISISLSLFCLVSRVATAETTPTLAPAMFSTSPCGNPRRASLRGDETCAVPPSGQGQHCPLYTCQRHGAPVRFWSNADVVALDNSKLLLASRIGKIVSWTSLPVFYTLSQD